MKLAVVVIFTLLLALLAFRSLMPWLVSFSFTVARPARRNRTLAEPIRVGRPRTLAYHLITSLPTPGAVNDSLSPPALTIGVILAVFPEGLSTVASAALI